VKAFWRVEQLKLQVIVSWILDLNKIICSENSKMALLAAYYRLTVGVTRARASILARSSSFSSSKSLFSTNISPAEVTKRKIDVGENLHIRYRVVGNGPHVVLCLPGIVGK